MLTYEILHENKISAELIAMSGGHGVGKKGNSFETKEGFAE